MTGVCYTSLPRVCTLNLIDIDIHLNGLTVENYISINPYISLKKGTMII